MSRLHLLPIALLVAASPLAGQPNPFAIFATPYRSVRVVMTSSGTTALGGASITADLLSTPTVMVGRSTISATINGRTETQRIVRLFTADSTWDDGVDDEAPAKVLPSVRGLLAREYDALDAASKRRLVGNLKRLPRSATEELGVIPSVVGTRRGSRTVAGHPCDDYVVYGDTVCVMPRAPWVALRTMGKGQARAVEATKVVVDGAVAPADLRPSPGKKWKRERWCDCSWMEELWAGHHESDARPTMRELARFTVRWLASAEATEELAQSDEDDQ